jgi:hypothetical protein
VHACRVALDAGVVQRHAAAAAVYRPGIGALRRIEEREGRRGEQGRRGGEEGMRTVRGNESYFRFPTFSSRNLMTSSLPW